MRLKCGFREGFHRNPLFFSWVLARLELARREPLSMTLGLLAGEFPSRRIHSRRNGARD